MVEPINYEATVVEIETIIKQIESGNLSLEEVFEQFSLAVEELQKCEAFLAAGKKRMELLVETLSNTESCQNR